MSDEHSLLERVLDGRIALYAIERETDDPDTAVRIRREAIERKSGLELGVLSHSYPGFYAAVHGACCENVLGTVSLPVGVAGPLLVDGHAVWIPLATVEGALVASVARGCKALRAGVKTVVSRRGMARGVVFEATSIQQVAEAISWIEENQPLIRVAFERGSQHTRLQAIRTWQAGNLLFVRFVAFTGQAMGMNMVTRASEQACTLIMENLPNLKLISLSGNMCIDKKASHLNWLEGRGHQAVAEATIEGEWLRQVLHVEPAQLVKVARVKNLIGSAMAGAAPHGCNAHAANMTAAMFIATGQDAAQLVESSACMTLVDLTADGQGLTITCTLPSLEIACLGGGTRLPAQAEALKLLTGGDPQVDRMAAVMAAAVLAGELSLLASLAEGSLMQAHLRLNRK